MESGGLTIEWTTPNNITLNSTTIDNKFSVYQIDAGSNTTLTGLNVSRLSYLDQGSYQCRVVSRAGGQGVVLSSTVTTSLDLELISKYYRIHCRSYFLRELNVVAFVDS